MTASLWPGQVRAANCEQPKPRIAVVNEATQRGMVRVARARLADGRLLEVFAYPKIGRFQAIASTPTGLTCPFAHGNDWQSLAIVDKPAR